MATVRNMVLDAKDVWFDTDITLDVSETANIIVRNGQWTANPANGMVSADGHPGLIAKPKYALPGSLEGMLVGCIGDPSSDGTRFAIGMGPVNAPSVTGRLYLAINDDVHCVYGVGYVDNRGSVYLTVTVD
mgnify:CR=1 FL=1